MFGISKDRYLLGFNVIVAFVNVNVIVIGNIVTTTVVVVKVVVVVQVVVIINVVFVVFVTVVIILLLKSGTLGGFVTAALLGGQGVMAPRVQNSRKWSRVMVERKLRK